MGNKAQFEDVWEWIQYSLPHQSFQRISNKTFFYHKTNSPYFEIPWIFDTFDVTPVPMFIPIHQPIDWTPHVFHSPRENLGDEEKKKLFWTGRSSIMHLWERKATVNYLVEA